MARGALERFGADFALSVTGIAAAATTASPAAMVAMAMVLARGLI